MKIFRNRRRICFAATVLAILATFFVLNYLQPLVADDFGNAFYHDEATGASSRIEDWNGILRGLQWHYFHWSGRLAAQFFVETMLLLQDASKCAEAVVNSLVFLLYIVAIYKIASLNTNRKWNWQLLLVVFLLCWFLHYAPAEATLWITCGCNYLWMLCIALWFLYPFCKLYRQRRDKQQPLNWRGIAIAVTAFIGGVVAGDTYENTAGMLIVVITLLLIYIWRDKRTVPLWAWTGYAGLLAGFALLMTAPGNFERDAAVLASQNMAEVPLFKRLLFGFAKVTYRYLTEGVAVTAVLAVMYALYKRLPNRPIETRYLAVFPAAALLGLLAMSATVIFPQRAWFGIISFAIVAIAILYSRISVERQLPVRKINRLALLCLLAVAVSQYCVALGDMWQVSKTYSGYEAAVCEQRQSGKDIIALPASDYEFRSEFVNPFLSADTAHYANKTFSLYHGVKSVAVEK